MVTLVVRRDLRIEWKNDRANIRVSMAIEPFRRSTKEWLLVVGVRNLPPAAKSYERHWTTRQNWSSFDMAMSFQSEADSRQYLEADRHMMETADHE